MSHLQEIIDICVSTRKAMEPGFPLDKNGMRCSEGTCLYASFALQISIEKFTPYQAIIRGGGEGAEGVFAVDGCWHGHYWIEVDCLEKGIYVADITADQFGYSSVVVLSQQGSAGRYLPGDEHMVRMALMQLSDELSTEQFAA